MLVVIVGGSLVRSTEHQFEVLPSDRRTNAEICHGCSFRRRRRRSPGPRRLQICRSFARFPAVSSAGSCGEMGSPPSLPFKTPEKTLGSSGPSHGSMGRRGGLSRFQDGGTAGSGDPVEIRTSGLVDLRGSAGRQQRRSVALGKGFRSGTPAEPPRRFRGGCDSFCG